MQISSRAVMFWDFQLPPKIFYGVEIWRLARPLQDLEMLLTKSLLCCRAVRLGSLSCWKTQPRFIFNALADGRRFSLKISRYMAHSFFPLHRSAVLVPLQKNSPKAWCFHPMLHSRYGVLWMQLSILSPPNTTSWVFTKKLYFGFIWPYDILPILFWIIQMLSSKHQAGLDMYWLKQGDTSGTAGFESLAAQCVTDGSLCYFGPSSLQVIH